MNSKLLNGGEFLLADTAGMTTFSPEEFTTEQKQIAEIVNASKAKIRAFEQKEKALRQLKKALMHDLLTGTVRVDPALFKEITPL